VNIAFSVSNNILSVQTKTALQHINKKNDIHIHDTYHMSKQFLKIVVLKPFFKQNR